MGLVKLDTGFNIQVEFAITPFHKRLIAWLIDLLVCWLYVKLMSLIFHIPSFFIWTGSWHWREILVGLPVLFYHLICEIVFNGQSVGKMIMNIRIITAQGGQPGISQYMIRWVFRLIDFPLLLLGSLINNDLPWYLFPLLFCGLACVIFTERSQRIGDILADTIIIDLKNNTSWQDTVFTEVESSYTPKYPTVMHLSDRDINTLKSIIESVKRKNDHELAMRISDRIKSKLKIDTDQEPAEFLKTLLKDYNYYSSN
ncbi:MAG TPA: RDD family protein [Flavitalea sp.]|nr:RDD family protein [Flavitalea sp.]HTF27680.1 RDD family protein [Flavitalea sp.]